MSDSERERNTRASVKNNAGTIIGVTLVLSLGYAVLRYHIFGPVPWKDLPLFIFNKGISLSGFILLSLNFTLGPLKRLGVPLDEGWLHARRGIGTFGFLLVLVHVFLSYLIFNPNVFGKFFEADGTLTLLAGLSMLAGVLGLIVLWIINLSFITYLREETSVMQFLTSRNFLLVTGFLGAAHVFFMGIEGWMEPGKWYGGLPPISLVAFTLFVASYVINGLGRK